MALSISINLFALDVPNFLACNASSLESKIEKLSNKTDTLEEKLEEVSRLVVAETVYNYFDATENVVKQFQLVVNCAEYQKKLSNNIDELTTIYRRIEIVLGSVTKLKGGDVSAIEDYSLNFNKFITISKKLGIQSGLPAMTLKKIRLSD